MSKITENGLVFDTTERNNDFDYFGIVVERYIDDENNNARMYIDGMRVSVYAPGALPYDASRGWVIELNGHMLSLEDYETLDAAIRDTIESELIE